MDAEVLAAFSAYAKGKAVIDCGATETVAGLQAIQDFLTLL